MAKKNARKKLVDFLDERAFDPVLSAGPDAYGEADQEDLKEVQRKTETEKKRYHERCDSADEIRDLFKSDAHSDEAEEVNRKLRRLDLPTLPDLEKDFEALCSKLGVGPKKRRSA